MRDRTRVLPDLAILRDSATVETHIKAVRTRIEWFIVNGELQKARLLIPFSELTQWHDLLFAALDLLEPREQ